MYVAHLLTPETERTTHYLWAAARNSLRDDTQISEKIRAGIDDAFRNEDGPMIADCQQRMGTTDLMSLKPLLLKSDARRSMRAGCWQSSLIKRRGKLRCRSLRRHRSMAAIDGG